MTIARYIVPALVALALSGCGGGGDAGEDAPAGTSPTAAVIATPEAYRLAEADLGREVTDPEARRYDRELDRLERVCTDSRRDLAGMTEFVVEEAAKQQVRVRLIKVLRNVGLAIPDGQRQPCNEEFELYMIELIGP